MSEDMTTVIGKIKKLLALSSSPNVHEAANASRMARALMLKHDLDIEEVTGTIKSEIVQERFTQERLMNYKVLIYKSVAKYCFCRILVDNLDNFFVYGKKHHILVYRELVSYVMDTLNNDVLRAIKTDKIPRSHNASYRDGWANGFNSLIASFERDTDVDRSERERGLVIREDADVEEYVNKVAGSSRAVSARSVYSSSFYEGEKDGRSISMNDQLK
jgi:hypothetical protein